MNSMENMENMENMEKASNSSKKRLISSLTYDLPVLRARLGISQAELAERIGVSRQTYNNIETGKKEMTWTTCLALVAVFQNTPETKKMLSNIEGLEAELSSLSE